MLSKTIQTNITSFNIIVLIAIFSFIFILLFGASSKRAFKMKGGAELAEITLSGAKSATDKIASIGTDIGDILSGSTSSSNSSFFSSIGSTLWSIIKTIFIIILVIFIIFNIIKYMHGVNVSADIDNVSTSPQITIDTTIDNKGIPSTPNVVKREEVFNIADNVYTYDDAKAVCEATGARLATYEEIEDAYNNGGEWCNYGWSADQMALFPTQKVTWDNLQTIKGHENSCGRPGINGGYIANPRAKFGANCYGIKPAMTSTEQEMMTNVPMYPKTKKDIIMDEKVKYWQKHINDLIISPFNKYVWSE